jgi:hypothetical protein
VPRAITVAAGLGDTVIQSEESPFNHFIFSPLLKVAYCPVPKAACSSWKAYFRQAIGLPPTDAQTLHDRERNGLTYAWMIDRETLLRAFYGYPSYFRFVVTRNPYTRLASAYFDLVNPVERDGLRGAWWAEILRALYAHSRDLRPSETPPLSFEMFVRALDIDNCHNRNRHWQPQTTLAMPKLIRYDLVVKLEELDQHIESIRQRIGCRLPMTFRLNATSYPTNARELYTPELKAIVQRLYASDFNRFGYDPEHVPEIGSTTN